MGTGTSSGKGASTIAAYTLNENFPQLTGSSRQVTWAEQIRDSIADELYDYVTKRTSDGNPSGLYDIAIKGKAAINKNIKDAGSLYSNPQIKAQREAALRKEYEDLERRVQVYNEIVAHTDAKYWIDRRTNQQANYMNQRFKAMIDGKAEVMIAGKKFVVPDRMRRKP